LNLMELKQKHNLDIKGIIHIGANTGQELKAYEQLGVKNVIFIEPIPEIFAKLTQLKSEVCNLTFYNVAISHYEGKASFNVTNNGESSSLLDLKQHRMYYPGIYVTKKIQVDVITLDKLIEKYSIDMKMYNMINMDIQGNEFNAIIGSRQALNNIDYINLEVNKEELYGGCAMDYQIDFVLSLMNYYKVAEIFEHHSWGDAFYIKKNAN